VSFWPTVRVKQTPQSWFWVCHHAPDVRVSLDYIKGLYRIWMCKACRMVFTAESNIRGIRIPAHAQLGYDLGISTEFVGYPSATSRISATSKPPGPRQPLLVDIELTSVWSPSLD